MLPRSLANTSIATDMTNYFRGVSIKKCLNLWVMADRQYDIIVYGANGFTAGFVIRELRKASYKVATCARSISKIPGDAFQKLEAAVENIQSVTSQTRLLINCAGPYANCADPIIKACIASKTHYVDFCGETQVLRAIRDMYGKDAEEQKVKIVQACGFDSVPADLGAFILCRHFESVEITSTLNVYNSIINTGTWNSLLQSLMAGKYVHKAEDAESQKHEVRNPLRFKKVNKSCRYNEALKSYDVPFKGSDGYVTQQSAKYFRQQHMCYFVYTAYLNVGPLPYLVLYYIWAIVILLLSKLQATRQILEKYPTLFSFGFVRKGGPSSAEIEKSRFEMVFTAKGQSRGGPRERNLTISGPDPGYIATAAIITQCAYALLDNEKKIPNGVLTPAQAFHTTDIIEHLSSVGLRFEQR